MEKTMKITGPRVLQSSHWGMLCASDTPEGEKCGLTKNLALLTHITISHQTASILQLCLYLGLEDISMTQIDIHSVQEAHLVYLDGNIVGIHSNTKQFVKDFRKLRRKGLINQYISICFNALHKEVWISADFGRICRPLIIVEHGKPLLQQDHITKIVHLTLNIRKSFSPYFHRAKENSSSRIQLIWVSSNTQMSMNLKTA